MRRMIIVSIVAISAIFAQISYFDLYKNDIIDLTKTDSLEFNNLIEKAITIHPNLIYYTMNLVNHSDITGYNAAYFWYAKNKNLWLNKQITLTQGKGILDSLKMVGREVFEKYKIPGINLYQSYPIKKPTSIEHMQYFIYKYFSKNKNLRFNPSSNYTFDVEKAHAQVFGKLAAKLNRNVNKSKIDTNVIKSFSDNWYILSKEKYRGKFIEPGDYVANILRNDSAGKIESSKTLGQWTNLYLFNGKPINIGFDLGYLFHYDEVNSQQILQIDGFESSLYVDNETRLNLYQLGYFFSINLTNENTYFSYIRTDLVFAFSPDVSSDPVSGISVDTSYTSSHVTIRETYELNEYLVTFKNISLYGITISTPLYFLNDNLVVEGSLGFDMLSYTKEETYNYSYSRKVGTSPALYRSTSGSNSENTQETRFLPGMGIRYMMGRSGLYLNLQVNTEYTGFKAGYAF